MKASYLILALLALSVGACQLDAPHPDSPEGVVRQYQMYLDNNQFEQAKNLSTPEERQVLDGLAAIFTKDLDASSVMKTSFLRISCKETGDKAECECKLKDEFETYDSVFRLVRQGGKWLVDVSDDPEIEESLEFLDGEEETSGEETSAPRE